MVLYLIGLGLGDVKDITVKGLEIVRICAKVYLEAYTSVLCYGLCKTQLETFYGRELIVADRNFVEQGSDTLINEAKKEDIAILVVGDPFGATTHADLVLRAKKIGVEVRIIHNASILNAIGCCGLQLYSFGMTISMVMWTDSWQPDSYYEKILINRINGLHTLCLLDIKTKEQSIENLIKGNHKYEPPRYMTCAEAAQQLLKILEKKKKKSDGKKDAEINSEILAYKKDTRVIGLARVGWDDQRILCCSLKEMASADLGSPLHALVIPGTMHPMEEDFLNTFNV